MFNQKGQIHIILLVLLVLGFILYVNFSDKSFLKFILPTSSSSKSTPAQKQLTPVVSPSTPGVVAPAPVVPVVVQDRTPPVISNISHQGDVFLPGTREVVISVSTDEPASCRYTANPESSSWNAMSWYDETRRFHVKTITGLRDGMSYDFFVRCQDFNGNSNTGNVLISFSVKP
ncbi:MAG: hypothetical protein HYT20_00215 [Candidatus Nealsonbacteria bacterium]|nr:hypothetical protein [Candidatus Nealsonbacteria bacterium]